jgi:uncharacterized protein (TIGR02145 family)
MLKNAPNTFVRMRNYICAFGLCNKKKINYFPAILLACFIVVSIYSCSKIGPPPTCKITYPKDGQVIEKCETVDITVLVEGKGRTETAIVIDGKEKVIQHSGSNINYLWRTYMEDTEDHTIRVTCADRKGATASDVIKVKIVTGDGVTFTDPRDIQEYYIVEIGSQTWFAQDLKYNTNDTGSFENYGAEGDYLGILYNWNSASTACPSGWHLPSDDEWKALEKYIGMSDSEADKTGWRGTSEGKELKSKCGWDAIDGNGNDSLRFTAMPYDKGFGGYGSYNYWWTNTEGSSNSSFVHGLYDRSDKISRDVLPKDYKISVRCVKD